MMIYYDGEEHLTDDQRRWIELSLETVLQVEGLDQDGEVSISLVSADDMQALNLEYRGKDQTTDVLSFPQVISLEDAKQLDYLFLGDVVINLEQVSAQAKDFGHSEARELSYLTVHSLYHLLGFDHEIPEDKERMRAKEKHIMTLLEEQ